MKTFASLSLICLLASTAQADTARIEHWWDSGLDDGRVTAMVAFRPDTMEITSVQRLYGGAQHLQNSSISMESGTHTTLPGGWIDLENERFAFNVTLATLEGKIHSDILFGEIDLSPDWTTYDIPFWDRHWEGVTESQRIWDVQVPEPSSAVLCAGLASLLCGTLRRSQHGRSGTATRSRCRSWPRS